MWRLWYPQSPSRWLWTFFLVCFRFLRRQKICLSLRHRRLTDCQIVLIRLLLHCHSPTAWLLWYGDFYHLICHRLCDYSSKERQVPTHGSIVTGAKPGWKSIEGRIVSFFDGCPSRSPIDRKHLYTRALYFVLISLEVPNRKKKTNARMTFFHQL